MTDVFEPVRLEGNFISFIQELNLAAAQGKQYVICSELGGGDIALETRAIKVIRGMEEADAYLGS
jgi:hypothetical protein